MRRIWLRCLVLDPELDELVLRHDDEPLPAGVEICHLNSLLTQRFGRPAAVDSHPFPGTVFPTPAHAGPKGSLLVAIPMVINRRTRRMVPVFDGIARLRTVARDLGSARLIDRRALEDAPWAGPLIEPYYWRHLTDERAARTARAWLVANGLVAELDAIMAASKTPVPRPGLKRLSGMIDKTAQHAASLGDLAGQSFDELTRLSEDSERRAGNRAKRMGSLERRLLAVAGETLGVSLEAERLTRALAQTALGVAAFCGDDDRVQRFDRAAVAVLYPPPGHGATNTLLGDGLRLAAANRQELVVEVAGMVCRVLCDRRSCVEFRPRPRGAGQVEVYVDPGDTLVVRVEPPPPGPRDPAVRGPATTKATVRRWPSPVTVLEPARFVVAALFDTMGLNRVSRLDVRVGTRAPDPSDGAGQPPSAGWVM